MITTSVHEVRLLWPRATSIRLGLFGVFLFAVSFVAVLTQPFAALKLDLQKYFYVLYLFAAMLLFGGFGAILIYLRRTPGRRSFPLTVVLVASTLLLGLIPPISVVLMLYCNSELTAASSLLVAVALGGMTWSLSLFFREHKEGGQAQVAGSSYSSSPAESHRSSESASVSDSLSNHE